MKKKVLLALTMITLFIPNSNETQACSFIGGDNWYEVNIDYNQLQLPVRVKLYPSSKDSEYILSNNTNIPLYVIRENRFHDRTELNENLQVKIPDGYSPVYKIEKNKTYYWMAYHSEDQKNWIESKDAIINTHIYNTDGEVQQIRQDNRPMLVKIPKPQEIDFDIFYNNEIINIKGELSYSLNPDYHSRLFNKDYNPCPNFNIDIAL